MTKDRPMSENTSTTYHIMLVGLGLEMALSSLDEDYDIRECSYCVLMRKVHFWSLHSQAYSSNSLVQLR